MAQRRKQIEPQPAPAPSVEVGQSIEPALRFMRSVAMHTMHTKDVWEWMTGFCGALKELLGDVDTIGFEINHTTPLSSPGTLRPGALRITQEMPAKGYGPIGIHVSVWEQHQVIEKLLSSLERAGWNLSQYHPPPCYEYYYERAGHHLAAMALLRSREKRPVSEQSNKTMKALESFLMLVMSSFVIRRQLARPEKIITMSTVNTIMREFSLSTGERNVLSLRALGLSYGAIAERLHISEHTVAKRIANIHSKAGCSSIYELILPRLREQLQAENEEAKAMDREGMVWAF